jgi:hypothetical protein
MRQLLVMVASVLEKTWQGRVPCEQPMDMPIPRDNKRLDQDVLEQAAFGTGDPALPPLARPPRQLEKHIASLASLGKCGKGFWLEGKLHKHMVRYFLAGRRHFSEVESVCISLDASRIGGKEVYVACIGGYNKAGQCKVMWAPPQEPAPPEGVGNLRKWVLHFWSPGVISREILENL